MLTAQSSHQQCRFLDLPLEIRSRVYEFLFFAEEKHEAWGLNQAMSEFESRKLNWASTGLAGSTGNQIHPYRRDSKYQPHFDLCILRTNHQIQLEAERVFYGWSSFNLTGDAFAPGEVPTFQFFQSLPPRYRKLIRRVEIRCFYRSAHHSQTGNFRLMSLFDWNAFMKFLASECPSLRSLILWGFADGVEGKDMERCCRVCTDWVQSILQIKTLRFFDIAAIPRRKITKDQSCVPDVVQQLRSLLYQQSNALTTTAPVESPSSSPGSTFPLLQLPLHLRNRIYRFVLLPANKCLHPYLKSWYDGTTRNAVPLFLTCRQIQEEAEAVLYGEGIFCAPSYKYDRLLTTFLQNLSPRLLRQINHKITYHQMLSSVIGDARAPRLVNTFRVQKTHDQSRLQRYLFIAEHLYKPSPIKRILIETDDLEGLSQQMRDWITQGFIDLGSSGNEHLILRLDW